MLGDVLVSTGAITAAQLEQGLAEQRVTGALLGETLLSLAFITEQMLARALAHEAGVPFSDAAADKRPDPAAVALVPEPFARKHLLAPLALKGAALHVLQANPFDVLALDDLRQLTARPIATTCASPVDVRALLDRGYAPRRGIGGDGGADVSSTSTPQHTHENAKAVRTLSELGLSRKDLSVVSELLERSSGLLLVTGSAGTGTTTSLYAMLTHLARASRTIVTLEASVAWKIPSIRQTQIGPGVGSFAHAMRAALRHKLDVAMIDALGDPETARLAVHAAVLSGVLVLSSLPTDDPATAAVRLTDMGLEPYLLATGLAGVVGQRLIRLICSECTERVTYPAEMLERVGLTPDPGLSFHRGQGCAHCGGSGYRGRTGVFEILVIDAAMQLLIRERADARRIRQAAVSAGLKTIREDALAKAILQQTTLEEVLRVTHA